MAEHRPRILEQDGYTRRGFFGATGRLLGAAGFGFFIPACAAQLHPGIKMDVNPDLLKRTVDIGEYLKQSATKLLNRRFPTIARSRGGRRADFDNYLRPNNPLTGAAAVSYAPNPGQNETYVTPGAYAVIVGLGEYPISGIQAAVFYGNGYIMYFGHLKEWDGYRGKRVSRFTKIGEMGDTGAGAREPGTGIPIKHLNTVYFGAAFDQFLAGTKTQYRPLGEAISPFVKDSEEFSVLIGKSLPFPAQEDLTLDENFNADLVTARNDVDAYLRVFPHNNTIHPQKVLRLQNSFGIDLALDRDIFYLYYTILSLIRNRNDNSRELGVMKTRLEQMMLLSPRLTAPILEPSYK
jgi:murein DD-endopeptidase MepM/ murein hydrolase activator NlpD